MTQKKKVRNTERVRTSTQIIFGGHHVCTNTFCFFAHNEPQEAQVHKSQVDGEQSRPSKPCVAPPSLKYSGLCNFYCVMQIKMRFCCLDAFQAINMTTFSFIPPRAQSAMYWIYITALPWSWKEPVQCVTPSFVQCVTPSFAGCGGSSLHRLL